jgi:5-methyltetrahydrofolate--homocysteine methyltransferase
MIGVIRTPGARAGGKRPLYPESPEELALTLGRFLETLPIHFVGGCCGTTPAHIRVWPKRSPADAPAEPGQG